MRTGCERGFTLLELMVTVAVIGILLSTAIWEIGRTLPTYRVGAATSRLLHDLRSTSALAARVNRPVFFQMDVDEDVTCPISYSIQYTGEDGDRVFQSVCISDEYKGVEVISTMAGLICPAETAIDATMTALPACSLCDGGTIVFLPNGEVQTEGGLGASIVFTTRQGEGRLTRAVGLRGVLGKSRIYQWDGAAWECR